jgi:DNA-binding IclR family transcriptional regulator
VTTQPGTRRLLPETGLGKTLLLDNHPDVWDQLFTLAAPHTRSGDWQTAMRQAQHCGALLQRGPAPDHVNSASVRNAAGRIVAAIECRRGCAISRRGTDGRARACGCRDRARYQRRTGLPVKLATSNEVSPQCDDVDRGSV